MSGCFVLSYFYCFISMSHSLFQHAPGLADLVELVIVASVRKAAAPAAVRSTRQLGKGKKLNMAAASPSSRRGGGESDSEGGEDSSDENEDEENAEDEDAEEDEQPAVRGVASKLRKGTASSCAKNHLATVQEEGENTFLRTVN